MEQNKISERLLDARRKVKQAEAELEREEKERQTLEQETIDDMYKACMYLPQEKVLEFMQSLSNGLVRSPQFQRSLYEKVITPNMQEIAAVHAILNCNCAPLELLKQVPSTLNFEQNEPSNKNEEENSNEN